MSVLFDYACRYELFDRNPIYLVRQGAKRRRAPTVLMRAEIKALVDNLSIRERTSPIKRQEINLPLGSMPVLFLSRHSAPLFERSSVLFRLRVRSAETLPLPVAPFHYRDGGIRFLKPTSLTVMNPS
jgi:hypothetical protein